MKSRRFSVYAIIYMVLVGVAAFVLEGGDYTLKVLGYEFTLPIACWIVLPVAIFAFFAIIHVAYHSLKFYNFKRAIKKDGDLYAEYAKEVFLALPSNKEYRTDTQKLSTAVTKYMSPWGLNKDVNIENEELLSVINVVKNVQNGDIEELKKYKLSKDNPLYIQNEINKVKNLKDYYLEILKNDSFSEAVDDVAYEKLIKNASFADIKKLSNTRRSSDDVMCILKRYVNDEISISADEMYELLNDDKISAKQYTQAAMMLKDKLKPDAYKVLFEKLRTSHQDAEEAYLYVLYELVLLDELREIVQNHDKDEHVKFKTLLYLKDNAKSIPSSLFFK